MGDRPNNEALMTPFKPPRKIDRPTPSTSTPQRLISKRRRRTSSCDSESPEPIYDSNSATSDSDEEDENQDLPRPTYPLTPPTSSPPLNPHEDQDPHSDSDSDSLLRVSAYDLLLARIRERRVGVEKSRGVEGVGEVKGTKKERGYEMERVKKRPFIAPAVALKEEEEEEEEKEEVQRVGEMGMKVKMRPMPNSEVEMGMGSEGNDSDSSGELRAKKREVFVGEAYKRPRRVEISELAIDRQDHSNRIIKHKGDSSYAMPDEERLDSQGSQEDWLPSPEQVFGIGRGYSKSTSDSEAS
ncbi:BZ3500_MvSof-1268-A1-R1_Chr1-1g00833 [Microbotryum saponariae]|uniref:BZ3500_MvSof-1268-A1-R1_Chr1-1g00833 protein n=1 Tax=Microbotryum saponariae TaxID=289078 RepID=A0A2X0M421_9BASI|nr:BZ3500_MvSof-1268-A1-R1_Chr1-1g00833 [Microbotryum saponariae]SCZ92755.1 BZ3501_MvSof-1269-A2-R1_Chr1-1g00430 [Microbotryum saponariae]